jgi:hypothetical protein
MPVLSGVFVRRLEGGLLNTRFIRHLEKGIYYLFVALFSANAENNATTTQQNVQIWHFKNILSFQF